VTPASTKNQYRNIRVDLIANIFLIFFACANCHELGTIKYGLSRGLSLNYKIKSCKTVPHLSYCSDDFQQPPQWLHVIILKRIESDEIIQNESPLVLQQVPKCTKRPKWHFG